MRNVTGLRCLYAAVAAVALGLSAERVNAQDEVPLAATPTPPPDVQEREKAPKPPAHPGKSPEVDELLKKLRLTRADIEQRKADKSQKELPAATDEPPDVKEKKKAEKAPAPPGRSPDLDELLDKIRKQPGGAEKLERARKAGAKIPPGKAGGAAFEFSPGRMSGPRVEGSVFVGEFGTGQQTTLRVTKPTPSASVPGLGSMWMDSYMVWMSEGPSQWGPIHPYATPNWSVVDGPIDVKPYLGGGVYLTSPGWYLINFVASGAKASLRKWDSRSRTSTIVTQWDNSANPYTYQIYPYLVELAAGYHYFYWVPESGYNFATEVTVAKL
jgi:hypothetical protein